VFFDQAHPLGPAEATDTWLCDSIGLVRPIIQGETLLGPLAIGRKNGGRPLQREQLEVIQLSRNFYPFNVNPSSRKNKGGFSASHGHELEIARSIQESCCPNSSRRSPAMAWQDFA